MRHFIFITLVFLFSTVDVFSLETEPTTTASNVAVSSLVYNGLTLSWDRGDGDSVIVIIATPYTDSDPVDGNTYSYNSDLSIAPIAYTTNGTNHYALYKGTGTSVDITGLTAETDYEFVVYEYNSTGAGTENYDAYSRNNKVSTTTPAGPPTVQSSNIIFSSVGITELTIDWTTGNGSNRIVCIREGDQGTITNPSDNTTYSASSDWSSKGDQLGTSGYYTVYNGSSNTVSVTNLSANTTYWIQIFEYNGDPGGEYYLTSTATDNPNSVVTLKSTPTLQAIDILFSNITDSSMTLDWTRGDGDYCLVIAEEGVTAEVNSPSDGTDYTANTVFGSGDAISGTGTSYVLYKGTGNTVDVKGFTDDTTYAFKVFEFNNTGSYTRYIVTDGNSGNPRYQSTLAKEPTVQSSNIVFSGITTTSMTIDWTSDATDGGDYHLVAVREGSQGVIAPPKDEESYTASSDWANKGSQLGQSLYYIVYDGTGSSITVTNLRPGTSYWVQVFDFNGSGGTQNYLTTTATDNPNTENTLKGEPTVQATDLAFSQIKSDSITVSWSRGNGDSVIVVAKLKTTTTELPADGTVYVANNDFGNSASKINGTENYVVYDGNGSSVTVTNLASATEYEFVVYEYNNGGSDVDYYTVSASNNPLSQYTLDTEPTAQPTDFNVSGGGSNDLLLEWVAGNGTGRIVIARQGDYVNVIPEDGVDYIADANFGSGSEIGTGNYVVYSGSGESIDVTNLLSNTKYYFQVFEYNNNAAINYNTTSAPTTLGTTGNKGTPTVQSSNIIFTDKRTTSVTIKCTKGNGDRRLIVMKEGVQGTSPVVYDYTTYSPVTDWSAKTITDTVDDGGYYAIYSDIDSVVTVTNLSPNTTYWIQVYEYNNSTGNERYLSTTATDNPNSTVTLKDSPSTQASSISSPTQTSTTISLSWSRGDGDSCIVVARLTSGSDASPVDYTDYTANTIFGTGSEIGTGNYVVYNGTGTAVAVTGLESSTSYTFNVFEYNNASADAVFNTTITTNSNSLAQSTQGDATWQGDDATSPTDWSVAENWDIGSVPSATVGVIIPSVTNQPVINDDVSVETMTIDAGAYITISDGYSLTISGDLVLKSPAGYGASGQVVIPGTGTLTVNGTSTMERYYGAPSYWRLVSSPLTSPSISNWSGYYVNAYDEPNVAWIHLDASSTVGVMQGVSVKNSSGNQTIAFSGTFNTGNKSISVTNSSPGDDNYGWNIVGNPYPSAVDWKSSGVTRTNVDGTAYIYDASTGSYDVCNTTSTTCIIPAGQGFFIHASDNGSLAFSNTARVASTDDFNKNGIIQLPRITLKAINKEYSSNSVITFIDGGTEMFDNEYDAYKLLSYNTDISDIFTLIDDGSETLLAINALNTDILDNIPEDGYEIPVGITRGIDSVITIKADAIDNIDDNIQVLLYDSSNGEYINLRQNDYNFILDDAYANTDRFKLVLLKSDETSIVNDNLIDDLIIFTTDNTIFIKTELFIDNPGLIQIYNVTGKLVNSISSDNSDVQRIDVYNQGMYIVKIVVNNKIFTQKVVVR